MKIFKKIHGLIASKIFQTDPQRRLLRRLPKNSFGAEIGVWKGSFSVKILTVVSPKKLYLIDPWEFQEAFPERMFGGKVARSQKDMDAIHDLVVSRTKAFDSVRILRSYSHDALDKIPDASLDWVYVDGNHYYDFVLRDVLEYHSKVKKGGLILMDDFFWGAKDSFPVRRAVNEAIRLGKVEFLDLLGDQAILRTL